MRIQAIHTWVERFTLTRPYTIAFRSIETVENVIVEISAASGITGLGVASPEWHVTGETFAACRQMLVPANLEWLIGRDGRAPEGLCRQLAERLPATPAARAALDMALHDLAARHLGLPVVEMLGRRHRQLPTSITIGIKSVDETLEEAREYLGRGFRVLKVKLGHSLEEDLQRLHRLREVVGPAVKLRVDANQGYDKPALTHFIEATASLDLEFIEQPLPVASEAAMRALPLAVRARLAADECLLDADDALRLAGEPCACGIFNVKLMKCGGIYAAQRIASIAEAAGIELMWGCMDESAIGISAALHAGLASPATRYLDLDGSLDLASDVVTGGFVLADGCLRTTDKPGLGVERSH